MYFGKGSRHIEINLRNKSYPQFLTGIDYQFTCIVANNAQKVRDDTGFVSLSFWNYTF